MEILTLFACCAPFTDSVSLGQLSIIAQAIFSMSGRVTMLGISRWTERGGSYGAVQGFFAATLAWEQIKVKFFETHLFNPDHEYILAGDETVISKSGSQSFGVDRLFSSLRGQVIRGLGFLVFSIVNTVERRAYPLMVEQRIKEKAPEKPPRVRKKKRKGKLGRPAGSRLSRQAAVQAVSGTKATQSDAGDFTQLVETFCEHPLLDLRWAFRQPPGSFNGTAK
jgi:putative transposase